MVCAMRPSKLVHYPADPEDTNLHTSQKRSDLVDSPAITVISLTPDRAQLRVDANDSPSEQGT